MLVESAVAIAILLAVVYIGVPYYQAYKRRKELARKNLARRHVIVREDVV